MKAVQFRQPFAKAWFVWGAFAMAALAVSIILRDYANDATPREWLRLWRYVTGVALVGLLAYQWALFFARRSRDGALIRRRYKLHKYIGVAFVFLFVLHAGAVGSGIMGLISIGIILIALTGLLGAEVLFLSQERLRKARLFAHYAISAVIVPLILLHIYTALAYK